MLTAKTVVKNKYWIVERDGDKIATILASPTGVTYVSKNAREQFASINLLKTKYSISFDKPKKQARTTEFVHEVNGFPCDHTPFNSMLNLTKKLPVYTKTEKSKSFFCAGHYLIQFSIGFVPAYCPKLITLNRYQFHGPFKSKQLAKEFSKTIKV